MKTSRRTLLAGLAGLAAAPTAATTASASPAVDAGETTVAEQSFARMIAYWHRQSMGDDSIAAGSGRGTTSRNADHYVDAHWQNYVEAARAVLNARS